MKETITYYNIYNIYQARFLISKGCKVNNVGLNNGKCYIQFLNTEDVRDALTKWKNRNQ